MSIKYLGEKVGDIAKTNDINDLINKNTKVSGMIAGMPQQESELRSDGHFYLNNNMQKSRWVYYTKYYYHVDGAGNIEKSKWIEQRYVGEDGRMYRGRQTPDGKWVGDDGLVVKDVGKDLKDSALVEEIQSDAWYKTQSGLWYYFENDRTTTRKGWFTDNRDGQTYYLDPSTGIMAVGWTEIDGDMYYFNENGGTEPNWYEVGDGIYESYGKQVKSLGSMYKNEITPNGKEVGADGRLIEEETDSNFGKYYDAVDIKNEIMAIDITEEKKKFLFFNIGSKYDVNIYLSESAMKKCIDKGNKFPKDIMYLRSIPLDSPDNVLSRDKNAIVIKNDTYKEAKNLKSKIEEDEKMLDNFYLIFGDYNKLTEDAMNNANNK